MFKYGCFFLSQEEALQGGGLHRPTRSMPTSKQVRSALSAAAAAVRLTVVRFRNIIVQIDIATEK